jgi:hypothetical protein
MVDGPEPPRKRPWRLALVIGFAVAIGFAAWRLQPHAGQPDCAPGREEVVDPSGKVVAIRTTTCFDDQ